MSEPGRAGPVHPGQVEPRQTATGTADTARRGWPRWLPAPDTDRWRAFARYLWQRFRDDNCFQYAGALSYTTVFALVPLTVTVSSGERPRPSSAWLSSWTSTSYSSRRN